MPSFSRMLLVYDGTDESQAALSRCAELSLALSAQVDVMSVVDAASANANSAGMLSDLAYTRLEEFGRHTLRTAIGKLADNGITAHGYLTFGHTVDAVLRHAAIFNSDIVVLGHRTRKGLSRWWGDRPVHLDLAERLLGSTIITVTLPSA
ncbi:universal stress protein [Paraburkholderia caffeinilytica]|uniref:universal stress protein n=1 Tax=Paraburkholderia caffeinilytica TaxID=1761016 RepID=UPI0038B9F8DD